MSDEMGDVDVVRVDRADYGYAGFVSALGLVREMAEKAGLGKQRELDAKEKPWLRRVNRPGVAPGVGSVGSTGSGRAGAQITPGGRAVLEASRRAEEAGQAGSATP